jgi:hypothetical protein
VKLGVENAAKNKNLHSVALKQLFVKIPPQNLAIKIIDFIFDQPFNHKRFLKIPNIE